MLEEKQIEGHKSIHGAIDIFFGCRNPDEDYIFKEELKQFKAKGIVNNLFEAFSRVDVT